MRQSTKIRGLTDILAVVMMVASITMPLNIAAQTVPSGKEWVVVIDAGHGGKDPGTLGPKSREKNINLAVALKTGKYIKENLRDVKVIYTRDDDTFVELDERANVANRNKADIFISIHSNWISDKRVTGAETFVLGQSMDDANLQVAMKENSVITFEKDYQTKYEGYDPNSVESFIIFSLMQNTYLKQSTEFASIIQDQFRDRVGRRDRGVKQAGFIVLWRTTMPSVLVEMGFVSNTEEEKFLISDQGQDYLASAIFRAFRDYKQSIDSRSGLKNGSSLVVVEPPARAGNGTAGSGTSGSKGAAANASSEGSVSSNDRATGEKDTASAGRTATQPGAREETGVSTPAKAIAGTGVQGQQQPPTAARVIESLAAPADDICFMVQIAAMPGDREIDPGQLKGIDVVTKIDAGERVKYAAGNFKLYDEALKYRRTMTARFPDAFVIALRNGKIMPLREAIEAKKKNK